MTTEPDALFEPAIAAGASVVRGLRDEDYGSRGFTVRDPRRVFWSFGTYAGSSWGCARGGLVPAGRSYAGHRPERAVRMRC